MSVFGSALLGSSLSSAVFVPLGSSLSVASRGGYEYSSSVSNGNTLGSTFSARSFMQTGGDISASSSVHLGSALSTRSFWLGCLSLRFVFYLTFASLRLRPSGL